MDYQSLMQKAQQCEQTIGSYRVNDETATEFSKAKNFAVKAQNELFFNVVQSYERAIEIYCRFNKKDDALRLLDSLFGLVDTCDVGTVTFAIQLLLAIRDRVDTLERFRPNTKQEVKSRLYRWIQNKIGEHEIDFGQLRGAILLARSLATVDTEEVKGIDEFWGKILIVASQSVSLLNNHSNAAAYCEEAARIFQQLGNQKLAQELLANASELHRRASMQPSAPNSIVRDLSQALLKRIFQIRSEPLLPSIEEIKHEYDLAEDKLGRLLRDERFLVNALAIQEAAKKHLNAGLLNFIPMRDFDKYDNARTDLRQDGNEVTRQLEIGYVMQIEVAIASLFAHWEETSALSPEHIYAISLSSTLEYDWTIFRLGVKRHFEKDYLSSIHLLIPQFENVLREWAQIAEISVKKLEARSKGIWGQKLLNDLTNDSDVQQYLGSGLGKLVNWYLAVNEPFGYRHKVAHGFISPEKCSSALSAMLIWLTLLIITKSTPASIESS